MVDHERITVKEIHLAASLDQATLSPTQQNRLVSLITAVFERAIDARSPKNRPPGKAGLRAEKGYYRLLYLEGDFREKVNPRGSAFDWDIIPVILRRLKDIPELQSEIMDGIEAALTEVADGEPGK
jgi:hypothetical protein